jgi:hypothetical protein
VRVTSGENDDRKERRALRVALYHLAASDMDELRVITRLLLRGDMPPLNINEK